MPVEPEDPPDDPEVPIVPNRTTLIDDFEDYTADDPITDAATWANEAGGEITPDVVSHSGSNVLYITDTVVANNVEVTKTLPFAAVVGDIISCRVKPVTCADSDVYNPHVYLKLREGDDVRVYLRIDTLDGGVDAYDSAAWVASGLTMTLDAWNNLSVTLTSTTTTTLAVNNYSSSALTNNGTISTSITKLQFDTPTDNSDPIVDDFGTRVGGENIRSVTASDGASTWNAWTEAADCSFTTYVDGDGRSWGHLVDANAAAAIAPIMTFPATHAMADGDWYEVTVLHNSGYGSLVTLYHNANIGLFYPANGEVQIYVAAGTETLSACTNGVPYTVRVYRVDNTNTRYVFTQTGRATVDITRINTAGRLWDAANISSIRLSHTGTIRQFNTMFTDIRASWLTATGEAATVSAYVDDLYLDEPSEGLQAMEWTLTSTNTAAMTECIPLLQADGSVLLSVEDPADNTIDVYRVSGANLDTWTKAIDTGTADGQFMGVAPSAGTVYCIYKTVAADSYIAKSVDYGVNWTISAATGLDIEDLFCIGTTVFAVTMEGDGGFNYDVHVYQLTDDTPTFVDQDLVNIGIQGVKYVVHGFVDASDNYWFAAADGAAVRLLKYEDGTPEVTDQDTIAAVLWSDADRRGAIAVDPEVTWTHNTSGIAFFPFSSATSDYLYRTDDGGDDWTSTTPGIHVMSDNSFLTASSVRHLIDTTNLVARAYKPGQAMPRVVKTPEWTGYTTTINLAGDRLFCSDGTTTLVFTYQLVDASTYIKTCEIASSIVLGPRFATQCDLTMKASDESRFSEGQVLELYDGHDTLAFEGKITRKTINRGQCFITAMGHDRELGGVAARTLAATSIETVFETMIGTRNWLWTSSSVDPDASISFSFNAADTADTCSGWHVAWLMRLAGNCIVYVEPGGKTWVKTFDDLLATGLRVHEGVGQWRLDRGRDDLAYEVVDTRCTRASCVYASKTRVTYSAGTGMAIIEANEGVTEAADIIEPNFGAATSATTFATNAWTIFSTSTTFLRLIARNQGFLQPGKTIEVSWSQGEISLSKTTMVVLGWTWDAKNDVLRVLLGTGVATPHEMDALELDCDGKHEPA